jgi:hypothetical protein
VLTLAIFDLKGRMMNSGTVVWEIGGCKRGTWIAVVLKRGCNKSALVDVFHQNYRVHEEALAGGLAKLAVEN